jgi:hypothetical protein
VSSKIGAPFTPRGTAVGGMALGLLGLDTLDKALIVWYIDALINQLIGDSYGTPRRCPCRPHAVRADYDPRHREQ